LDTKLSTPQLPPLTLRANFSWTFAGNVVYMASQWAILVLIAKLTSPEDLGRFALALAICAPVILLFNLHLRTVLATDIAGEYPFSVYLITRSVCLCVALLAISGIVWVVGYRGTTLAVVAAMAAAKSVESVSDIHYGLLHQYERLDFVSQSLIVKGVGSAIVVAIVLGVSGNVVLATWAIAGVWALLFLLFDRRNVRRLQDRQPRNLVMTFPLRDIARLARRTWPLGVVAMLISLNPNIPRYVIDFHFGPEEVGFFAALAYTLIVGKAVVGSLGKSAAPRLSRLAGQGLTAEYGTLVTRLVLIAAVLGGVGVGLVSFAGEFVLTLLYTPEYADHSPAFLVLMVAAALNYVSVVLWYALTAAGRRFGGQLPLFVLVATASLIGAVVLVPDHGTLGAAWSTVIAAVIQMCGTALLIRSEMSTIRRRGTAHDVGLAARIL
jgi:O-antigen/teichoic acid export membrane protein